MSSHQGKLSTDAEGQTEQPFQEAEKGNAKLSTDAEGVVDPAGCARVAVADWVQAAEKAVSEDQGPEREAIPLVADVPVQDVAVGPWIKKEDGAASEYVTFLTRSQLEASQARNQHASNFQEDRLRQQQVAEEAVQRQSHPEELRQLQLEATQQEVEWEVLRRSLPHPTVQDVSQAEPLQRLASPRGPEPPSPIQLQQLGETENASAPDPATFIANPQEAEPEIGREGDSEKAVRRSQGQPRLATWRIEAPWRRESNAEMRQKREELRVRRAKLAQEEENQRVRLQAEVERAVHIASPEFMAVALRSGTVQIEKAEETSRLDIPASQEPSSATGGSSASARSAVLQESLTPREMLGLKKLKPDKQRQKLEEMVARFEAESPEIGTGETFLHKACQAGNAAAAAALIALAPETGQLIRDESGLLPVDHAILNGHRSAAAVALRGLPLEELNTLSLLLLPLLLQTGNLELPQQASLNAGLRAAAASGRDAAVELLIKNRAEVNSEQDDGATALVLASRPGHISVARQLLSAGACPDQGNRSALRVAAETGRLDLVKLLLEHRADVEASKAKRGGSPLLFAAKGGHLHCMEELLRASASLEGNKEWLPLHAAVQSGKEAVQLLLSARASPSVPARTWAPLHEAARRRSVITTELLLNHGSPIDAATADGATALHLAVQQGHEETVQVLLSRGASAGCRALSGAAPLHYAVQQGHLQLVQLLLANNADPDQSMVDAAGIETDCRPLHFAAQLGLQDILKNLLAARANAETEMRGGFTPLALAARAGHMTCCQILLEANVSRPRGTRAIDAVTATGWTPLHLACKDSCQSEPT
eukprot:symbB.v1.2.008972.t1/scaffold508.1/size221222/21